MEFKVVARGLGFLEGPVAMQSGAIAVTSIDTGDVFVIDDPHGAATVKRFSAPGGGPNGAAEGSDGSLFIAQNGGKWPATRTGDHVTGGIQVVRPDGSTEWLSSDLIS